MEQAEVEMLIGELETRLDRLRSLYDQYFCGIEKLEPQVARKDVERRFYTLRKEQIRNTGLRFRFNMLVQRFSTFQTHWQRISRQIENGTYKRDVIRAKKRFGQLDPALAREAAKMKDDLDEMAKSVDIDVDDMDFGASSAQPDTLRGKQVDDLDAPASAPARSSKGKPSLRLDDDFDDPFGDSIPPPPANRVPSSLLSNPAPRMSLPPARVSPGAPPPASRTQPNAPQPPPIPAGASKAPPLPGKAPPLPPRKPAMPAAPGAAAAPPSLPTRDATSPSMSVATLKGADGAPKRIVLPPRRPTMNAPPLPNAEADRGSPTKQATLTNPARPATAPERRRTSRPPKAPTPAAAPNARPAPKAPTRSNEALTDERVRQLYTQYVDAKRSRQESTASITYDNLAKSLRESSAKLKEKHTGKNVDFEVAEKDGKTILRPVVK